MATLSTFTAVARKTMSSDLVLDRDVRDWVLVPLTVSIFLMMLIRQYATQVAFADLFLQRVAIQAEIDWASRESLSK